MRRQLLYIALWTFVGFALTALANRFLPLPWTPFQGGLTGLIVGLLLALLPTLSTERGRRLFYEGPRPDEDGDPLIGCLWLLAIEFACKVRQCFVFFAIFGWPAKYGRTLLVWLVIQLIGMFRR